jgi:gliding motility-associated-like protein
MDGSTIFAGPINGDFGVMTNQYFNAGIIVSPSTISVTSPNGTITSTIANCADHSVPVTLENNNYCTPTVVELPWSITCDLTGTLIASGTHTVTVYPQVPTSASDLVSIDWNSATCSWDVTPQNDCGPLDLDVLYSISPDPGAIGAACADGTEEFTVTYLGFQDGPDCCSTGGPLTPATYTNNQGTTDFITQTAYGGTNNAAYGTIPASGIGGNSTSVTIDVSGSGYCYPNVPVDPLVFPADPNPDSYYVDIYVDGVQIALYGPLYDPPGSFNYSFNHADLLASGVTYNQNSVVEVYVLPNQFFYSGPPVVNTNYMPGANCNTLAEGQWSAGSFSIDVNAVYEQLVASPANCSFIVNEPYTCCSLSPLSAEAPANDIVQCFSDLPVVDINSVTNIISDCPVVVAFVSDVSDGNTCPEIITRTYSVSDDCGNSINVTQTITVNDITPPTASSPTALTVECIGDLPAADVSVVSDAADNCSAVPTVSFVSDASDGNTCPETITRTYSVTDDCGNSINVTQTITVNDITPPTASNPSGLTVECIGDVPVPDVSVVTDAADNCTVVPLVDFVSEVSNGNSSSTIIYSETFDSGTIAGANASVLYGNGGSDFNSAYALSGTFFGWFNVQNGIGDVDIYEQNFNALTAGCTASLSVWLRGTSPISDITITLTDDNGVVQSILDPVLTTSWQLFTINTNITTPGLNFLIHYNSTGSGAGADVIMEDLLVIQECASSVCPEVITRTYSVTDDCGNATNVTHTITVNDLTPPTASNPIGVTVECVGDIPIADASVVTDAADNCTAIPTVSFLSDASDGNSCPEIITRIYSITDDCGNSTNVSQTITVNDITPPTASNPSNINIPLAPAPTPDIAEVIDAEDNCAANPVVAFVSDQSDGGNCPEVITRIYSVTDDCGNETLVTQLIIIGDVLFPAPTVTANGPICEGEEAVFTINGLNDAVVTYDFGAGSITVVLTGGTANVTLPNALSDVTITLSNIADGTCASVINETATVVVNPAQQPSFSQLGPYCQGDSPEPLLGTSLGGISGSWAPNIIDATLIGNATYTFTPDPGQCSSVTTMEVEIAEPTVPLFTQIDDICEGAEVFPGGSPFPVVSIEGIIGVWAPVFDAFNTTTYTFTPDPAFCATTTTMTINIVGLPVVDAGEDQIINCTNNVDGVQIGSGQIAGNVYSWSPTAGLSDPNIANPIANPSVVTDYIVTVTNSAGCSADGTVNISVDDTPPVVAITNNTGSTTLTCTQLEISVTASGADSYTWDNGLGNTASSIITSPGIYTVTGTGANGCESTAEIEVFQDNGVDLLLALAELEICSGEAVDISMNSTTATNFNWTVIENGVSGASNGSAINAGFGASISQVLTLTGAINGTVDYAVEPILDGCVGAVQTVTVTVLAPENPQFNQLGPFCVNDVSAALPINSTEGISGTWSPATVNTTTVGTSTYSFVPNSGQCADTQTMDIVVNELPVVSFSGDSLVGCAPHTVVLTSPNSTCTWTISNGTVLEGSQATLVLTNPGCYDVTLQVDENGCANTLTLPSYICIEQDPIADFTASPDMFTDDDALVSFTNLSSGASSFVWDFGDGNTSNYINPSNLYESTEEGALITLTAISAFGCMDQAQLIIEYDEQEVFYIPNTFTPDGDNFNQMFTPIFYSGFDPYNFEMLIFNRWGEIVFETHNTEIGWDGTYGVKGTKATDGAYSWKITYKNPKTDERKVIVGHVTLMR